MLPKAQSAKYVKIQALHEICYKYKLLFGNLAALEFENNGTLPCIAQQ